jgi:hypothetical protein
MFNLIKLAKTNETFRKNVLELDIIKLAKKTELSIKDARNLQHACFIFELHSEIKKESN